MTPETRERLRSWLATQLPDASNLGIEELGHANLGHSAETILLTLTWATGGRPERRDVVLRLRPAPPGLLEPYDLGRQYTILRALEATEVPTPRAYWREPTGDVLGREFYVMERCAGTVYETDIPADLQRAPERLERMSRSLVETVAAIHNVDLDGIGLRALDERDHVARELDHWTAEFRRVQRDQLPALERLARELAGRRPPPSATIKLVHGDPKPGNFAFDGDQVSAVFDWELATIGDPLTDIGWLECNWRTAGAFTMLTGALTCEEAVAFYEQLIGTIVENRAWYRALATFKMSVIMLVGAMLFDSGVTDDLRFANMGLGVEHYTTMALGDLGIDEPLDAGPVTARRERVREVRSRSTHT